MLRRYAMIVLAAGCVVPAGCGWFDGDSGGGSVTTGGQDAPAPATGAATPAPQLQPPIGDAPVPMDFKLEESQSRNYAVAGTRFVDHVYRGRGDKFTLKRFYERYMPVNRWVKSTSIFAQGRVMLDFEKPGERCRVTITDSEFWGTAEISVLIWPNRPMEADAATPPS
ncbi:MAG: hypothetical protein KGY99_02180 [Phycisphaerae bacterium]|nr:hypothetical protein [Phycisphaerae bacterium]